MKKIFALLSVLILAAAILACAAKDVKPELRPAQKLMQARVAWLTAINENLGAKNYDAIAKNANELAAQTQAVGEKIPNPLGKELTLAISSLAREVSTASTKQDSGAVKVKLGEIKGKCSECHVKIRDKK